MLTFVNTLLDPWAFKTFFFSFEASPKLLGLRQAFSYPSRISKYAVGWFLKHSVSVNLVIAFLSDEILPAVFSDPGPTINENIFSGSP